MNVPKLRFPEFNEKWEEKKLIEVANVTMGQSPKGDSYTTNPNDTILIQGNADIINEKVVPRIYTNAPTKMCEVGDVILSVRAPVGEIGISQYRACLGRGVCSINSKNHFIYHVLSKFRDTGFWKRKSQGSTFESINGDDIKGVLIHIPTISEQNKISTFFDMINKKIQLQQEKMDLLKEQKKGYMQKIFTQELRFKDEDGKPFPQWEKGILSDLVTIIGGGTPSSDEPSYWGGEYQWFIPTEITQKYSTFSNRTITKLGLEKSSAKLLPTGTILLTSRATLGEMSILLNEACTNQGFQSLVPNKKTISEFIYTLQPQIKKYCYKNASGSTFLEISKSTLEKMPIMIPALKEQIRIAALAENLDKRIQYEFDKLEVLKIQKQAFMQQMFI